MIPKYSNTYPESSMNEDSGKLMKQFGVKKSETVSSTPKKESFFKADMKTFQIISGKLEIGIQLFTELADYLDQYGKIKNDAIKAVVSQLSVFKDTIDKTMSDIPVD